MRGNRTQCRIFKRCLVKCLVIFAAISLLPFALIYLISTDQINRIKNYDVSIQICLPFCSARIPRHHRLHVAQPVFALSKAFSASSSFKSISVMFPSIARLRLSNLHIHEPEAGSVEMETLRRKNNFNLIICYVRTYYQSREVEF